MKIRWTNYRKDAAMYRLVGTSEIEVEPGTFQQFVKLFGFSVTNPHDYPDCYWKVTSYNSAEMIQVLAK